MRRDPTCCRDRFADCLCRDCDPFAWEWRLPPAPDDLDAMLVGAAVDTVLSLLDARAERRRWAARALAVMRSRGLDPAVEAGALRVPMDRLPEALRAWLLADPQNRAAVEELLDEERERGLRLVG